MAAENSFLKGNAESMVTQLLVVYFGISVPGEIMDFEAQIFIYYARDFLSMAFSASEKLKPLKRTMGEKVEGWSDFPFPISCCVTKFILFFFS